MCRIRFGDESPSEIVVFQDDSNYNHSGPHPHLRSYPRQTNVHPAYIHYYRDTVHTRQTYKYPPATQPTPPLCYDQRNTQHHTTLILFTRTHTRTPTAPPSPFVPNNPQSSRVSFLIVIMIVTRGRRPSSPAQEYSHHLAGIGRLSAAGAVAGDVSAFATAVAGLDSLVNCTLGSGAIAGLRGERFMRREIKD